jgi:hypothetical protein
MKCLEECKKKNKPCEAKECRKWIDYEDDLNCCLEAVEKNGDMTLREVADRMGVSYVRIKQIQDAAVRKLSIIYKQ